MWRSMYVDHLQKWLKVFPSEAMLVSTSTPVHALPFPSNVAAPRFSTFQVVPSESLKEANSFKGVMERFVALLGLPHAGPEVHNELIFKASPASTDSSVHENRRSYIGEIPPEVSCLN